ncbi:hypothetical protein I79_025979 [Cricetulus griseus]|uniref:Uncharacterized protein n=1 Tax=Cricetulus griseus TaxID=10029 RepID=G3IPR0_CRIGR|nr:hypothetical protein I79_025979 [Cricetulus griseus]
MSKGGVIPAERDVGATEEFFIIFSIHLFSAYCVPRSMLGARNSKVTGKTQGQLLSVTLCDPDEHKKSTPSGLTLRLGLDL